MTGEKYGRLTAIKLSHVNKHGAYWLFKCDCGEEKVIHGAPVRRGRTLSCGCLAKERFTKRITKHGMAKSKTYDIWVGMKQRCLNPKSDSYKNYGGKGISICEEWLSFEQFYRDMGEAPEGMTIERVDNNSGYSKENCKWATRSEQNVNKTYTNKTTGIKNISYNKRDNSFSVGICRNKKRYRKDFKNLDDAIQWRDLMLKKLDS